MSSKPHRRRGEKVAEEVKLHFGRLDNMLPMKPLKTACKRFLKSTGEKKISKGFMQMLAARLQRKLREINVQTHNQALMMNALNEANEPKRVSEKNLLCTMYTMNVKPWPTKEI